MFYLGLWAGKALMLIYKLINNERDDKPGLLAYRFDNQILKKLKKPKLTVVVTGTNGKTTTSSLITDLLRENGLKVAYNDWGANTIAGHIRCLLGAVNIFNKPIVDAVVLEADERTSNESFPAINPDYIVVTNICRDSIRRNAYPSYIKSIMTEAINSVPNAKLILNADDPLSSFIDCKNEKVYFSIEKEYDGVRSYNAEDFKICPKCYSEVKYIYQHYRHIGKFKCPKCGFESKKSKYIANDIDFNNRVFKINYDNVRVSSPMISDSIFNVYNLMSVYTFGKSYGFDDELIIDSFKKIKVPELRENREIVKGIELAMQMTKGQNVSASSVVFEYLNKEEKDCEVVMVLNEAYGNMDETETVTWLYETDFEFLKKDNIKKIIVGSNKYLDYKMRLLLAGIDEEKIVCVKDEYETYKYVDIGSIEKVYVLYEVDCYTKGRTIMNNIKKRIEDEINED